MRTILSRLRQGGALLSAGVTLLVAALLVAALVVGCTGQTPSVPQVSATATATLEATVPTTALPGTATAAGTATATTDPMPTHVPTPTPTRVPTSTPHPTYHAQMIRAVNTVAGSLAGVHVTVHCPAGTRLLSGGYAVEPSGNGTSPSESYPPDASTWEVAVGPSLIDASTTVSAVADCLQTNAPVTATIVHAQKFTNTSVAVNCPTGTLVTGGGFQTNLTRPIVQESQPHGNGWQYAFFASSGSTTITAYAICAKAPLTAGTVQYLTKTLPVSTNAVNFTLSCPSGQLLTGGGMGVDLAHLGAQVFFPLDRPAADALTWQTSAVNSYAFTATASAYAVCVRLHQ